MIFAGSRHGVSHIEMILNGLPDRAACVGSDGRFIVKTQTRRESFRYEIGKTYAIQPGRGKKGLPDVRIRMLRCVAEFSAFNQHISEEDAIAEGGYTVEEYEELYSKLYPGWIVRHAYTFEVVRV